MGGRYQGGVGDGMGSFRLVGPNGRDQAYIPGRDPSYRKDSQQGGKGKNNKNKNKVGGTRVQVSGSGLVVGVALVAVGIRMPIPGWVVAEWVLRCHQVLYLRRGNRYNFAWTF